MNEDFLPTASIERLRQRAEIVKNIREFFDQRGFFHVETPVLSSDTVVDRFLEPLSMPRSLAVPNADESLLYLQTSPEFGMKRLLVAGAEAIYQIGKVFRASEVGSRHNPEFTMLEWYRVGDGLVEGMALLSDFAAALLQRPPAELLTYCELFQAQLGVDPIRSSIDELAGVASQHEISVEGFQVNESARDDWLNLLLSHLIEPGLGRESPVIIYDWPASQSALAVVREGEGAVVREGEGAVVREGEGEGAVAERFELYVDGIELANGYHELLDPDELLRRNKRVNRQRAEDGSRLLPDQSRLLRAMRSGMPACSGVAVGVDRLVMVALGVESIGEVIPFPIDRA